MEVFTLSPRNKKVRVSPGDFFIPSLKIEKRGKSVTRRVRFSLSHPATMTRFEKLGKAHFKPDSDCVKGLEETVVFSMFMSIVFLP